MSILIKGMEMPKSPVLFCIHPDGKVFADLEGGWREYKAIPVPPHGRLIDADELVADIKGQAERLWTLDSVSERDYFIERNEKFRQAMFKSWCESMFAYLDTRPTIIEREVAE